jgi:hypothetical protein
MFDVSALRACYGAARYPLLNHSQDSTSVFLDAVGLVNKFTRAFFE